MPAYGERLSERELDVLRLVADGAANREIADALVISPNTVKAHLRNIYTKLGVSSRTEATTVALQQRLLALAPLVPDDAAVVDVIAATETAIETAAPAGDSADAQAETSPIEPVTDGPATRRARYWRLALFTVALLVILFILVQLNSVTGPATPGTTEAVAGLADEPIADSNWYISQPLPAARASAAVAAIGLDLYLIGGSEAGGVTNRVDIFETNNRRWHDGANKPTAVTQSGAAVLFGQIYVPGGLLAVGDPTAVVEAYSPANDAWLIAADLPAPVSGAVTLADSQFLYVIGGFTSAGVTGASYAFDPGSNSWRPIPSLPTPRGNAAGGIVNGQLYVAGGRDDQETLATCERYDPVAAAWSDCPDLLQARHSAGATVIPNRFYVLGGELGTNAGSDDRVILAEFYDPAGDSWQLVNLPESVAQANWAHFGMAGIEQRIYVLGGMIGSELTDQNLIFSPFPFQSFIPAASSNR